MIWPSLVCLALVALLAYREWGNRRDRREAAAELASERAEAARERRELYQRIQAPETAVLEHVRSERGPYERRKPIGADDDAAFLSRNGESERG